ncbi:hypothetical protein ACEQ8H_001101 [Pleosporales sp. CAS-2024a]
MAGLADPTTAHADHPTAPNATRAPSSRRSLPSGPCNYRDAAVGQCGCGQFWDKLSADVHEESADDGPGRNRSTWCVCGHHACFHLRALPAPHQPAPIVAPSPSRHAIGAPCSAQCDVHHATSPGQDPVAAEHATYTGRPNAEHSDVAQRSFKQRALHAHGSARMEQGRDAPSQASTSGLPSIPSVCMLSRDQGPAADTDVRSHANQSNQTLTGLGLSVMQLGSVATLNRQQSPTPTVPDDLHVAHASRQPVHAHELAPTRASMSALDKDRVPSPSWAILDPVLDFNRNFHLDVPGDTIPNTYNLDECIQSATELATPSVANTPDLGLADKAVQDGKNLIDTLNRLASNMQQPNGSPGRSGTTSAPGSQRSPAAPQEQLQQVLRAASPQALQKLVSYLAPLHNLLISIPNVANTMRDMGNRLDMLENSSFNYVQPEDLNQMLSMHDDRLVSLEYRMDEHEKHHQAIDADQSSNSGARRRIDKVTESFESNHSLESTTSSALILAAVHRKETDMEFSNIKDRLDVLESVAPPCTFQPWDVEVVLIPWGRHLRGIWFSPDEPMYDTSKTTTQDSDDWTQARDSRSNRADASVRDMDSSPYHGPHTPMRADDSQGWSSQAISDWASGSADDWLFPKACGSNNLVYKRLQSRGFVRHVKLKSPSARDFQATLCHAFSHLLEHLSYTNQDGDAVVTTYPGLRASFIPLRKVHKESKLRFLSPAEMSTSALWTAQFLMAGVMMRVSGNKKRLYVTQREAYIQHSDDLGSTWTWQELRQLPRVQTDLDSQMEDNDEHGQLEVSEADAKETCWQYMEAYDAPPASVHSSFGSHQSVQLSMRPADRQWRRSITPSSILKNRIPQPISPQSEFYPRPAHFRHRTTSASIVEPLAAGSSKRRFHSSPTKQSSAPQPSSRTPSVSVARLKRRRTANLTFLQHDENAMEAQSVRWNPTRRRSREPPSPFFSSQPVLARSNSDVATRPSQRSMAVAGKSTPFAYATPYSGPVVGGSGFGGYNNGGDTEADHENDVYEDEDGEQSWRGVTDGERGDGSSSPESSLDSEAEAQVGASYSGDESHFGSESGDEDEHSEFDVDRHPRHDTSTDEDEEDGDVFDTLLDVLEH